MNESIPMKPSWNQASFDAAVEAEVKRQMEKLQDPDVVLANMLSGKIAKLTLRGINKAYGEVQDDEDAQHLEIVNLRAELATIAGLAKPGANFNDWFSSLVEDRQAVLREDKWMLADVSYEAGKRVTVAEVRRLEGAAKISGERITDLEEEIARLHDELAKLQA